MKDNLLLLLRIDVKAYIYDLILQIFDFCPHPIGSIPIIIVAKRRYDGFLRNIKPCFTKCEIAFFITQAISIDKELCEVGQDILSCAGQSNAILLETAGTQAVIIAIIVPVRKTIRHIAFALRRIFATLPFVPQRVFFGSLKRGNGE